MTRRKGKIKLADHPAVYDQLVRNEVSTTVSGLTPDGKSYRMALELSSWPDFPNAGVYITTNRQDEPHQDREDFEIRVSKLDAFSIGLAELVRIAKERGFVAKYR